MPEENPANPLSESLSSTPEAMVFPQASAMFRMVPSDAEDFGTVPQGAEKSEHHTLTVREVARMFEAAGVSRTERSIINWCQPNRQGITRLDSYYDPNERRYFITPQSVETVIQEEIQRSKKTATKSDSEPFGSPVAHVKHPHATPNHYEDSRIQELEREVQNLKIADVVKDKLIAFMKNERNGLIDKLLLASRTVGQLETKVNYLESTKQPGLR